MRHLLKKSGLVLMTAFMALALGLAEPTQTYAGTDPSYAKWGTIAVKETQKKYNADITDYLHVGRKPIKGDVVEEQFKLIVRKKSEQEFGVFVHVQFDEKSGELLGIRYEKTQP
ncbi:hypothetical protein J2Z69_003588 [Paenibacillus shirakamiensis]|uniref:DUF3889 domain-containing protein n=1 Tax=Paenibacillus shirakamiensis TaxID=1265935 RepID=A0ABS4JLA9_9BACL|nr:DUF3889 domain-containing protein [Paenibacillus shirakamiensis]MBP2002502.1 hypothetical protein [Paenibacillus shirakamiensis]